MASAPWILSDELWSRIEPLLPKVERRFRYPGRKRLPDRQALQGILFVL
jgi:transposase